MARLQTWVCELHNFTYTFPATVTNYNPYFGQNVLRTIRPASGFGELDLGGAESPGRPGSVVVAAFFIYFNAGTPRAEAVRDLMRMKNLGRGRLFSDPENAEPVRWCYAKVRDINVGPEDTQNHPQLRLSVTIAFDVPGSRWYSRVGATYDAVTGAPSHTDPRVPDATYEHLQTFTLTNNGDEITPVKVDLKSTFGAAPTVGDTHAVGDPGLKVGGIGGDFTVFEIRRLDQSGTVTLDGFEFDGLGGNNRTLTINPANRGIAASWSTTLSDYITKFIPFRDTWLALPPGTHTFQVTLGSAEELVTLAFDYWDVWSDG
ncbi:MAG: hypothetical protein AAGK74_00735 [Chloroflexota bacterium]